MIQSRATVACSIVLRSCFRLNSSPQETQEIIRFRKVSISLLSVCVRLLISSIRWEARFTGAIAQCTKLIYSGLRKIDLRRVEEYLDLSLERDFDSSCYLLWIEHVIFVVNYLPRTRPKRPTRIVLKFSVENFACVCVCACAWYVTIEKPSNA